MFLVFRIFSLYPLFSSLSLLATRDKFGTNSHQKRIAAPPFFLTRRREIRVKFVSARDSKIASEKIWHSSASRGCCRAGKTWHTRRIGSALLCGMLRACGHGRGSGCEWLPLPGRRGAGVASGALRSRRISCGDHHREQVTLAWLRLVFSSVDIHAQP